MGSTARWTLRPRCYRGVRLASSSRDIPDHQRKRRRYRPEGRAGPMRTPVSAVCAQAGLKVSLERSRRGWRTQAMVSPDRGVRGSATVRPPAPRSRGGSGGARFGHVVSLIGHPKGGQSFDARVITHLLAQGLSRIVVAIGSAPRQGQDRHPEVSGQQGCSPRACGVDARSPVRHIEAFST